MATRWGIVSAGKISHDFVTALGTLPPGEHIVVGVAASDLPRAQDFAKLHKIQIAYGNYQDLADDNDVEVVYVGTVSPHHLEVAKLMLNHGKNVLCEKPLTMNLRQSTELITLAKEKDLFLMEGIWSRSSPIYDWIKEEIESGVLGDIKQVIVCLGLPLTGAEHHRKKNFGGGTVINFGVYTTQLASFIYNGEQPISIQASGQLDEEGIDNSISATLSYKDGRTATMMTHCLVELPNEAIIVGTKGTLKIPKFWCPTEMIMPSGEVRSITLPESSFPYNFINSAALRFEAIEVRKCLQAALKESPRVTHQDSLLIAGILDEIRRQIGVVYAEDSQVLN